MMLKNPYIFFVIVGLATSCSSTRRPVSSTAPAHSAEKNQAVHFIDDISISPGGTGTRNDSSLSSEGRNTPLGGSHSAGEVVEDYPSLRFKYAILLNASVEELNNQKLLQFMDEWYGIRYHYGGDSKEGIDCSAFVSLMMSNVYTVGNLPRVSRDQYAESRRVSRGDLREGDLVFFHTVGRKKTVTHVGVYLLNNKFIHASSSGVMISDLGDPYYIQRYIGAGRVMD
jgi:NlpC/P60 family